MSGVQGSNGLPVLFKGLLSSRSRLSTRLEGVAAEAVSSADMFRKFRSRCGSRVDLKDRGLHATADPRFDLYGMLYLDMALQFSRASFREGNPHEFQSGRLVGGYASGVLPSIAVQAAMWAELVRASAALSSMVQAHSIGSGTPAWSEDQWVPALAAFTPGRSRPQATWEGSAAGLRKLSTSDTWIALVDESSPENSDKPAYLAPLHLALCRTDVDADADSDNEPFAVSFYPSLLTALDYYSDIVRGQKREGALGWWKTLDAVEDWVASNYAQTLRAHPDTRQPLRGHHVARWDLARPIQPGGSPVVEGGSHGAAFALCLMQAVARAHVGSNA